MTPTSDRLPSLRRSVQRRPDEVLRIAHRGADASEKYGDADLAAVAAQGAHLVEFDVHVTGDDRLVACHDPVIRTNGHHSWLFDAPESHHRRALDELGIPTVEDVVGAAKKAGLGLYIDVKSLTARSAERLVELLESTEMTHSTVLASPRSDLIALCADVAPDIPRAVLFGSTLEEPVQLAEAVSATFVHPCWEAQPRPDHLLAGGWLKRVRSRGFGVITWHEERPDVVEGLYALGVDGICTDTPALLSSTAERLHHDQTK
ncbi:glycerophosphodiester phosphodiesterase [Lentzea sp. NPDC005914]|uniref:glycerophosphodiester phosphodiesterase n=1 Tax=Lentzea sp. NPDC005914 TaxID=3154572 RepID=UPI00340F20CC